MLSETVKKELIHDFNNIDFGYPAGTQNYNPTIFLYRQGEFLKMKYPSIQIEFLPVTDFVVGGMNHLVTQIQGIPMYGLGELEPVIITVKTKQKCEGTGAKYHGRMVAGDYIERIEKRIRRYWPKKLWEYGAQIKQAMAFRKADITTFYPGTEIHGYELSFYIVSPNKWNYLPDEEDIPTGLWFEDAAVYSSGCTEDYYLKVNTYYSVSGIMSE